MMKIRLQEGGVRDGRFYKDPVREIEVDDDWFIRNVRIFPPKDAVLYVGPHVFDAVQKEIAKVSRKGR